VDELISQIAGQFGIDNDASKSVVGKVIEMFTSQFDGDQRSDILSKLPGAEELISEVSGAAAGGSGGGGILGGLAGAASSMLGSGGSALEIGSILKSAGLDLDQAGPLVKMVIEFIQGKVGGDVVNSILEKISQLKELIGSK